MVTKAQEQVAIRGVWKERWALLTAEARRRDLRLCEWPCLRTVMRVSTSVDAARLEIDHIGIVGGESGRSAGLRGVSVEQPVYRGRRRWREASQAAVPATPSRSRGWALDQSSPRRAPRKPAASQAIRGGVACWFQSNERSRLRKP